MGTGKLNAGGNPAMDWHPIQGEVEILLVTSCYGNWDKLQQLSQLAPRLHFINLLLQKKFLKVVNTAFNSLYNVCNISHFIFKTEQLNFLLTQFLLLFIGVQKLMHAYCMRQTVTALHGWLEHEFISPIPSPHNLS